MKKENIQWQTGGLLTFFYFLIFQSGLVIRSISFLCSLNQTRESYFLMVSFFLCRKQTKGNNDTMLIISLPLPLSFFLFRSTSPDAEFGSWLMRDFRRIKKRREFMIVDLFQCFPFSILLACKPLHKSKIQSRYKQQSCIYTRTSLYTRVYDCGNFKVTQFGLSSYQLFAVRWMRLSLT